MRLSCLATCLILTGILLPGFCRAQDRAPDFASLLRGLEAHPSQLRSVSAGFTRVFTLSKSATIPGEAIPSTERKTVVEVEWAFKGPKYFEQVTDTKDAALQTPRQKDDASNHRVMTRIFDGYLEHNFDSALTTAGDRYHYDSAMHPPHINYMSPLDCGYFIAGKWIANALKTGHGALVGTEKDPRFGTLSILTCQGDDNSILRFWIAPNYNYMAVRTELSYPFPNKPNTRNVATLRCVSAVKVGSLWMPGVCSIESVWRVGGKDTVQARTDLTNITYRVNNVPDSRFDTTMPEGSIYYDSATQKRYVIGALGEKIPEEK